MTEAPLGTLTAADIMTRDVASVRADTPVETAIQRMLSDSVSGLPVVGPEGELVGMLTEGDLLRRSELDTGLRRPRWISLFLTPAILTDEYVRENARQVGDAMTPMPLVTAREDTALRDLVRLMETHQVKRIPIVRDKQLVGLVSRADLLQALSARLASESTMSTTDRAIRRRLRRVVGGLPWLRPRPRFSVRDGIVELSWPLGTSDWECKTARVAAETIPGVKEVREQFHPEA